MTLAFERSDTERQSAAGSAGARRWVRCGDADRHSRNGICVHVRENIDEIIRERWRTTYLQLLRRQVLRLQLSRIGQVHHQQERRVRREAQQEGARGQRRRGAEERRERFPRAEPVYDAEECSAEIYNLA